MCTNIIIFIFLCWKFLLAKKSSRSFWESHYENLIVYLCPFLSSSSIQHHTLRQKVHSCYILILVRLLMLLDFNKYLSFTKAPLVLSNLPTISLTAPLSDVTTLPRYIKMGWIFNILSIKLYFRLTFCIKRHYSFLYVDVQTDFAGITL